MSEIKIKTDTAATADQTATTTTVTIPQFDPSVPLDQSEIPLYTPISSTADLLQPLPPPKHPTFKYYSSWLQEENKIKLKILLSISIAYNLNYTLNMSVFDMMQQMNITNDRHHTNLKKVHQVLIDLVDAGCIKISVVTPPKQPNLLVPIDLIPTLTTQTLNINYYPDKDDTYQNIYKKWALTLVKHTKTAFVNQLKVLYYLLEHQDETITYNQIGQAVGVTGRTIQTIIKTIMELQDEMPMPYGHLEIVKQKEGKIGVDNKIYINGTSYFLGTKFDEIIEKEEN